MRRRSEIVGVIGDIGCAGASIGLVGSESGGGRGETGEGRGGEVTEGLGAGRDVTEGLAEDWG